MANLRDSVAEASGSTTLSTVRRSPKSVPPLPLLTILAHPDPLRVGQVAPLQNLTTSAGEELSRRSPGFSRPGWGSTRPLDDRYLSRRPIRFRAEGDGIALSPSKSKMQLQVDGQDLTDSCILTGQRLKEGVVLLLAERVTLLLQLTDPTPAARLPDFGLVGESDHMVRLRRQIQRVCRNDEPVLLRGETGTGKELVARALHQAGNRRAKPLISVNMAAIPANLISAELFGVSRGAFTGADRSREGFFQQADGGTLFLDEIGEAERGAHAALLRVLESGEIQPLGAAGVRKVDVRLVAATDYDLEAAIEQGRWSRALFHRLTGRVIDLPPLRQRRSDLGRLLTHFLALELSRARQKIVAGDDPDLAIDPRLMAAFAFYPWPGNVRELLNIARDLVSSTVDGGELSPQIQSILKSAASGGRPGSGDNVTEGAPKGRRKPSEIPHSELVSVLEAHRFRFKDAAAALGISRTSLYQLVAAAPDLRTAGELDEAEIQRARDRYGDRLPALAQALRVSPEALRRRLANLHD